MCFLHFPSGYNNLTFVYCWFETCVTIWYSSQLGMSYRRRLLIYITNLLIFVFSKPYAFYRLLNMLEVSCMLIRILWQNCVGFTSGKTIGQVSQKKHDAKSRLKIWRSCTHPPFISRSLEIKGRGHMISRFPICLAKSSRLSSSGQKGLYSNICSWLLYNMVWCVNLFWQLLRLLVWNKYIFLSRLRIFNKR